MSNDVDNGSDAHELANITDTTIDDSPIPTQTELNADNLSTPDDATQHLSSIITPPLVKKRGQPDGAQLPG